jgi:hypothetical protein
MIDTDAGASQRVSATSLAYWKKNEDFLATHRLPKTRSH